MEIVSVGVRVTNNSSKKQKMPLLQLIVNGEKIQEEIQEEIHINER
ncbi:hypothetical protein [Bacillus cereus]|nr:hypothetical protein [Bacillus cereus]